MRLLSTLENINLENCQRLEDVSNLPSNSKLDVRADGCSSLQVLFDISNYNSLEKSYFSFINCFELNDKRGHCRDHCREMRRTYMEDELGESDIDFQMLKILLHQGISNRIETFQIVSPGSGIPSWFTYRKQWSRHRTDNGGLLGLQLLPTNPYPSRLIGFALCAVFVIDERHADDELDIQQFKTFKATHHLVCYLKLNGIELEVCGRQPAFRFSEEFCRVESDHRWLFYVSSDKYFGIKEHDRFSQVELLIESRGTGLKVKECGVRLIFDEQELNRCIHGYDYRSGEQHCSCWRYAYSNHPDLQ